MLNSVETTSTVVDNSEVTIVDHNGFKVTDSFVVTVKAKAEVKEVNLQEVMATRLHTGRPWYSNETNHVAEIMGLSYNLITECRSHVKWQLAVDSFLEMNPEVTDKQIKSLKPKGTNGTVKVDKVVFTTTNAKNLGNTIFNCLTEDHKKFLSNYDPKNSDNPFATHIQYAVGGFKNMLHGYVLGVKIDAMATAKVKAEQEKQEQMALLRDKAVETLASLGIVQPDSDDAELTEQYEQKVITVQNSLVS